MVSRSHPFAVLVVALAAVLAAAANAAAPPPKGVAAAAPERLQVWADKILYHTDTGKFVFTGNVLVLKGDLRVDCDEMQGAVDPETREFINIVATGDVKLSTVDTIKLGPTTTRPATTSNAPDTWRALCSKADYDLKAGKIIMTAAPGKPRPQLTRAQGNGEADTIIFYPNKGEYELIGNPVIRGEIPTGPPKPATRTEAPKGKPAKLEPQPPPGTRPAPRDK